LALSEAEAIAKSPLEHKLQLIRHYWEQCEQGEPRFARFIRVSVDYYPELNWGLLGALGMPEWKIWTWEHECYLHNCLEAIEEWRQTGRDLDATRASAYLTRGEVGLHETDLNLEEIEDLLPPRSTSNILLPPTQGGFSLN
jgi:hypothetical protein